MAYLDNNQPKNRMLAIASVGAIHALLAAGLVAGLAVQVTQKPYVPPFEGEQIPIDDIIPDPEDIKPIEDQTQPVTTPSVHRPKTPIDISLDGPKIETRDTVPLTHDEISTIIGPIGPQVQPKPTPSPLASPQSATPKGNPGRWITTSDYKTNWINRNMEGAASFRLSVGGNGRVTSCQITSSTGHMALDRATCRLLTRRARFHPARNAQDEKVSGSYSSSILWEVPE